MQKDKDEITYYMNQVGIYKEIENAEKSINEMNNYNIKGYTYSIDDLFIVVTSITLNKDECINDQEILKKNNISFILKEVTTTNDSIITSLNNKNFNNVMELMSK